MVLFLRGTANEILAYRNNPDEAQAVTREGIDLDPLRVGLRPTRLVGRGALFRPTVRVSVWPRTIQTPHPPSLFFRE